MKKVTKIIMMLIAVMTIPELCVEFLEKETRVGVRYR